MGYSRRKQSHSCPHTRKAHIEHEKHVIGGAGHLTADGDKHITQSDKNNTGQHDTATNDGTHTSRAWVAQRNITSTVEQDVTVEHEYDSQSNIDKRQVERMHRTSTQQTHTKTNRTGTHRTRTEQGHTEHGRNRDTADERNDQSQNNYKDRHHWTRKRSVCVWEEEEGGGRKREEE
jgi:hypothetical protein